MSKSKTYKSKKSGVNIFILLPVILVALIAVILVVNGVQNAKIKNLMGDYTEYAYGERANVKMTHAIGEGYDIWQSEKYVYDVLNGLIYDYAANEADASYVSVGIQNAVTALEDGSTVNGLQYVTYTDANDFSKKYNGVVFTLANSENTTDSADAAAEKIWNIINSIEGMTYTGIEVSMFDRENEYNIFVDAMNSETLTLEAIKENITVPEEKSALYGYWLATVEAAENAVVENAEGETAENTTEE